MKALSRFSLLSMAFVALCQNLIASPAGSKQVEVFSWWTSGGEAVALQSLFRVYRANNPGIRILNASVSGGGGSAARPVLQTRLAGNNPPDTWQTHPGNELKWYVEAGYCYPVTDLYQSEGWDKTVPKVLVDQMMTDGEIYAVLAGVHRGNVLWYNKKVLQKNGIQIGDKLTFDGFFEAAEKLKAAGVSPLAVGDADLWATAELFENTLLGVLGSQGWRDLFRGKMGFADPKVKRAVELYGELLNFQNSGHSALSWDQAVKLVIRGQAGFTSMGDWTFGELVKAGLKENQDFGWIPCPGTDGAFIVVADGFTLAKNASATAAAAAWLITVGSKEAQEAFNVLKGSIPARTDVNRSRFGAYQHWSMDSFARDALLLSCVHGEAAPAAFQQALSDATSLFVADRDVDRFVAALVTAARDAGMVPE